MYHYDMIIKVVEPIGGQVTDLRVQVDTPTPYGIAELDDWADLFAQSRYDELQMESPGSFANVLVNVQSVHLLSTWQSPD